MAVTTVRRIPDQRERSSSTKDSLTETLIYHVLTDGETSGGVYVDTAATARTANDGTNHIPQPNTTIVVNGNTCLVTNVEAERLTETPTIFLVTVTAGIQPPSTSGAKWDVTITVDGDEYTEPVFQDKDHNPLTNSCNQSYDPPVEKTYYERETISVNFKSNTVDVSNISATRGKVNDASVTLNITALGYSRTFAAKTLQLKKASYTVTIANDGTPVYWQISYVLGYDPTTWSVDVVDRGLYEVTGDTDPTTGLPKLRPILDRDGQPVTTPQFLDGTGHKLHDGDNAVIDTYELYDTATFTSLFAGF